MPERVGPIGIVQFLGPVERQADEEPVLPKKAAPLVVQENSVGLQRVACPLTGRKIFLFLFKARRKKSIPISVGSPPWKVKLMSCVVAGCASIYWRMYASRVSSFIRHDSPAR